MVLKPNDKLRLTAEQLRTWPWWHYGYHGSDGCDWRSYATDKGPADIPDFAEEATPLTREQAGAWRLNVNIRTEVN